MKPFFPAVERRPAVIAGASSGIGAATAVALAQAGHPVALGARRTEKCEEVAARIREAGGEAFVHALDVASDESVEVFAEAVRREQGAVEVVVANAALTRPGAVAESSPAAFRSELDVNIGGAHRLVHAFVPDMIERTSGDIVFVSSDVAVRARPLMGAYAASKWGLEGMASALRMELEGTGVRASVVRPGPTISEMGSDWDAEVTARVINAWVSFGFARHGAFLPTTAIAQAITTVVTAPRGVHLNLVEVTPQPPIGDAP